MRAGHVPEVIFNGAWKIASEDRQFGPCPNEEVTVETPRTWANNGEKHGQSLDVVIRDGLPRYELFLR
jgi:hypothetical protein